MCSVLTTSTAARRPLPVLNVYGVPASCGLRFPVAEHSPHPHGRTGDGGGPRGLGSSSAQSVWGWGQASSEETVTSHCLKSRISSRPFSRRAGTLSWALQLTQGLEVSLRTPGASRQARAGCIHRLPLSLGTRVWGGGHTHPGAHHCLGSPSESGAETSPSCLQNLAAAERNTALYSVYVCVCVYGYRLCVCMYVCTCVGVCV